MALLLDIVTAVWRVFIPNPHISRSSSSPGVTSSASQGLHPHISLIFLTFTMTLSLLAAPGTAGGATKQRCYVCMPMDKNSSIAKDIEALFPGQVVPDCSNFPRVIEDDYVDNVQDFQFDCPSTYVGCALRSNGLQISRTCTSKPFQGCMYPNGVELCYCTHSLCNRDNVTAQAKPLQIPGPREPVRTSRFFAEGETDDEDLVPGIRAPRPQHRQSQGLSPRSTIPPDQDAIQEEEEGSGHGYDEDQSESEEEYTEEEEKSLKTESNTTDPSGWDPNPRQERRNLTILIPSTDKNESSHPGHYDPTHPQPNQDELPRLGSDKDDNSQVPDAPTVQLNGDGQNQRLSTFLLLLLPSLLYLVNRQS